MHTLTAWRMLPPAGAPLTLGGLAGGLAACFAGDGVEPLRGRLRDFLGLPHVSLHGSGREALAVLSAALRVEHPERDEVLLPAYGSYTLPSAVVRAGCRVALYDIDPADLAPRLESVHAALSPRTLAVVACHQYGFPVDLAPLAALCRERGITLVDDAAQALGARLDLQRDTDMPVPSGMLRGMSEETPAGTLEKALMGAGGGAGGGAGAILSGTMGDVGLFSFGRGKSITAVAGGVLATRDAALGQRLREAEETIRREQGSFSARAARPAALSVKALALWALRRPVLYRLPASLPWLGLGASLFEPGFAFRPFTAFQAGLALEGLNRLEALNAARRAKAAVYAAGLRGRAGLALVTPQPGAVPVYPRFPVLPAPRGDGTADAGDAGTSRNGVHLSGNGIRDLGKHARALGISPGFPLALHEIPALVPHLASQSAPRPAPYPGGPARTYPGAEFLARHLVTLPTHEEAGPHDCEAARAYIEWCNAAAPAEEGAP